MKFKDLLTPLNIVVVTIILILVVLIYKQREGFQSADENAKRKEAALRLAEEEAKKGCTDPKASNYDASKSIDNGSCVYPQVKEGCMDSKAINYDSTATKDNGSCQYEIIKGCTNPNATNYNPAATNDDGSCIIKGCKDENAINYDSRALLPDNSLCQYKGCTKPTAGNYNPKATIDDGSCFKIGCMDKNDDNYDIDATINDSDMCAQQRLPSRQYGDQFIKEPLIKQATSLWVDPRDPRCDGMGATLNNFLLQVQAYADSLINNFIEDIGPTYVLGSSTGKDVIGIADSYYKQGSSNLTTMIQNFLKTKCTKEVSSICSGQIAKDRITCMDKLPLPNSQFSLDRRITSCQQQYPCPVGCSFGGTNSVCSCTTGVWNGAQCV